MRITVVVPIYNKKNYLALTLRSILASTYHDFEVVAVDDGSTDGSADLVAAINDSRVRLIRQQNSGVSAARNCAIEAATGEWICFLDADDWQHPAFLTEIVKMIRRFPGLDAVATRFRPIPDSIDWSPSAWQLVPREYELITDLPARWIRGIPFFTGSIAVRKELLIAMQPCFPIGESYGEDIDLWFRIAERTNIALLTQPLIAYRTEVSSSLSNTHKFLRNAAYLTRLKQRAPFLSSPLRQSTMRFIAHQFLTQARLEAAAGQRKAALEQLRACMNEGIGLLRWWTTAVMVLCLPGSLIQKWQQYRKKITHA